MFLDQKIYQTGIDTLKNEGDLQAIKAMIEICLEDTHETFTQHQDDAVIAPVFKRINTAWNMAIRRLKSEGINITIEDGFLLFLLGSDRFKCVHDIVNKILKSNQLK